MDIERSATGDIAVRDDGSVNLVEGVPETIQRLRCKFQSFKGEWFLNRAEGIPYREIVWDKTIPLSAKVAMFRNVLAQDPAVAAVQQLSLEPDPLVPRQWVVNFTVTTISGQTLSSGDFAPFVIR